MLFKFLQIKTEPWLVIACLDLTWKLHRPTCVDIQRQGEELESHDGLRLSTVPHEPIRLCSALFSQTEKLV